MVEIKEAATALYNDYEDCLEYLDETVEDLCGNGEDRDEIRKELIDYLKVLYSEK